MSLSETAEKPRRVHCLRRDWSKVARNTPKRRNNVLIKKCSESFFLEMVERTHDTSLENIQNNPKTRTPANINTLLCTQKNPKKEESPRTWTADAHLTPKNLPETVQTAVPECCQRWSVGWGRPAPHVRCGMCTPTSNTRPLPPFAVGMLFAVGIWLPSPKTRRTSISSPALRPGSAHLTVRPPTRVFRHVATPLTHGPACAQRTPPTLRGGGAAAGGAGSEVRPQIQAHAPAAPALADHGAGGRCGGSKSRGGHTGAGL